MDVTATTPPAVDAYATQHTSAHDDVLAAIEEATIANAANPQMLSGQVVGGLLAVLAACSGAMRVLEIGTFTGYSALSIAQALPDGGTVTTCEIDADMAAVAQRNLDRHPAGARVTIMVGPAKESIASLDGTFDMVFLDAAKHEYVDYLELVLPRLSANGCIVADNTLWSGRVVTARADDADADTLGIMRFNERVANDASLRAVLLPVRDGVTLVTRR